MEWMKWFALAGGLFVALSGAIGLVLTQWAPRVMDLPFMRWMVTGRHLEPSRRNRILASAWALLGGTYIFLSASGYVIPALVVFVAWMPVAVLFFRAVASARRSAT